MNSLKIKDARTIYNMVKHTLNLWCSEGCASCIVVAMGKYVRWSRAITKNPILVKAAKQFLREAPGVDYTFEVLAINENRQAAAHADKNNKGHSYIIGRGDYTGAGAT